MMYPSFFNCHNCNCHRPIFYFFTFLPFYLFSTRPSSAQSSSLLTPTA